MKYGALETGGTKMVCAIYDDNCNKLSEKVFETKDPSKTVPLIASYYRDEGICALGIGTFGPVDLDSDSDTYGYILETPKPGWSMYPLLDTLKKELDVPMKIDTDVNCSCLGEITFGAAKGLDCVVYITIGTGIGAGIAVEGRLLHGMQHPEAGHILLRRHLKDTYKCNCRFHTDCFEGLAAGPAIMGRYGKNLSELSDNALALDIEAFYIAQALTDFILTLSPKRIILGGGVMHQDKLFTLIREKVTESLGGYIGAKQLKNMDEYIVPASLGGDQGILGAYALVKDL